MSSTPTLVPGESGPAMMGGPSIRGDAVQRGDKIFKALTSAAGILVLLIMASIGIFLIVKAVPALRVNSVNFFTSTIWNPDATPPAQPAFGIAALAFGTLVSSIIAMVLAVPVGFGIALFISHYAPRRLSALLGDDHRPARRRAVDHLRAVGPAVPHARSLDLMAWLNDHLGFIPIFKNTHGPLHPVDRPRLASCSPS